MNKYIIIKLPDDISLVDQLKTMDFLKAGNLNFQWYNQGFSTDKELFE